MAQPTPELASCLGYGNLSGTEEGTGCPGKPEIQNPESPSPSRLVPQNSVWRLTGRCTPATEAEMAVGVPVFRAYFDPWSHDRYKEVEDGHDSRCPGCSKISDARAAVFKPPHASPRGECSFDVVQCAGSSQSLRNPHACATPRPECTAPGTFDMHTCGTFQRDSRGRQNRNLETGFWLSMMPRGVLLCPLSGDCCSCPGLKRGEEHPCQVRVQALSAGWIALAHCNASPGMSSTTLNPP